VSEQLNDDPVTVASTEVAATKSAGDVKTMTVEQQYVPRADGTFDPFAARDQRLARLVAEILVRHFHGYAWHVVSEIRQGVVYFAIPDLMGPTLRWVIRLPEFPDLVEMVVMRAGGELLERMHLRRGPMDQAQYEWAKQNRHKFQFGDVKQ
jgi:hypothetical protein